MSVGVTHYLLTIHCTTTRANMHGYLITDDGRHVSSSLNRMMNAADELGIGVLPVCLVTPLTTGVEVVREILSSHDDEAKQLLEEATSFHFSAWLMPTFDPDDARLMALH